MWFIAVCLLFIKRLQPNINININITNATNITNRDKKFDLINKEFVKVVKGIKLVSLLFVLNYRFLNVYNLTYLLYKKQLALVKKNVHFAFFQKLVSSVIMF